MPILLNLTTGVAMAGKREDQFCFYMEPKPAKNQPSR